MSPGTLSTFERDVLIREAPRSRPCSEGCFSKALELQDPRNKDIPQRL